MSQFGMQMPGAARSNKPSPDIYTALVFIGVLALGAGIAMLWINGDKLSPQPGNALSIQEPGDIELNN